MDSLLGTPPGEANLVLDTPSIERAEQLENEGGSRTIIIYTRASLHTVDWERSLVSSSAKNVNEPYDEHQARETTGER